MHAIAVAANVVSGLWIVIFSIPNGLRKPRGSVRGRQLFGRCFGEYGSMKFLFLVGVGIAPAFLLHQKILVYVPVF